MTYRGTIKKGVVVFEGKVRLSEGTVVNVEPVRTFFDRYKNVIGKAKGLPRDFAENHDHYIHGTPKRKKMRGRPASNGHSRNGRGKKGQQSDFSKRYGDLVGSIKGMPADLAEQHDHYIHGTPKRK